MGSINLLSWEYFDSFLNKHFEFLCGLYKGVLEKNAIHIWRLNSYAVKLNQSAFEKGLVNHDFSFLLTIYSNIGELIRTFYQFECVL